MERIHTVLGNLVQSHNIKDTYMEKDEPWLVNLAAAAFTVRSTSNILKIFSGPIIILPWYYSLDRTYGVLGINTQEKSDST